MIIYIDENMSPYLARGFDTLQKPLNFYLKNPIQVKSISEEFSRGALDEEWIPKAGKQNACVITQDYNIKRIRHQRELCEQFNLGMFYFRPPSKGGFKYIDMLKLLVKNWEGITKIAVSEKRPFAYKVSSKSGIRSL